MSKTFCPLPFSHLYIKPNGTVTPCCRFKFNKHPKWNAIWSKSNIKDYDTLDDLLQNNEAHQELRQMLLKGEHVAGCQACHVEEESSGKSMRTWEIQEWGDIDKYIDQVPRITNAEITFGNYCNLACRICASELSTSWIDDTIKLKGLGYPLSVNATKRVNAEKDWKEADFDNMKKIKITGGEPFLHPDFLKFLDKMIESKSADDLSVMIFTNVSFIPKQHILDRMTKFKKVRIGVSVDGVGSVHEYIRHNSDWEVTKESVKTWLELQRDYPDRVEVMFSPTISLMNVMYIEEMFEWFLNLREEVLGEKTSFPATRNILAWPLFLTVATLPEKTKRIHELKKYKSQNEERFPNDFSEIIDMIIERLENDTQKPLTDTFVQYTKDLDKIRNQDFQTAIPKLFDQFAETWAKVEGRLDK